MLTFEQFEDTVMTVLEDHYALQFSCDSEDEPDYTFLSIEGKLSGHYNYKGEWFIYSAITDKGGIGCCLEAAIADMNKEVQSL